VAKAGEWYCEVVRNSQPFVGVYTLNNSTALIAAISNLSVSPPLLFYLVINQFVSRLSWLAQSLPYLQKPSVALTGFK